MNEKSPADVVLSDEEIEAAQGGAGSYGETIPGEIGSAGEIAQPGEIGREHIEGIPE